MICVKSNKEIAKMQKAGKITAGALIAAGEAIRPGMTTKELDTVVNILPLTEQSPAFWVTADFPAQPVFPSMTR